MAKEVKPKTEPRTRPYLVDDIVAQIKSSGRAKYEWGVIRIYKRKGGTIKLVTGDKAGATCKTKPYAAVFFRASDKLKRAIKKAKL